MTRLMIGLLSFFVFSLRITPIGAFLGFRFPVDTSDTTQFRRSGTGDWDRPSLSW